MNNLEVHPVADLFPMLADDELQELAADIKQRGLLQPIVLDAESRVLDGRNRLAACKLAGVTPVFEHYAGDDPDGYAYATNIARRHLSKGQRAMLAVRYSLFEKRTTREIASSSEIAHSLVGYANTIEKHAPALGDLVISGGLSLSEAWAEAKERKRIAEEAARQRKRLEAEAPDLFDRVERDRLDLAEAVTILDARQEQAHKEAEVQASEEERARKEQQQKDREHAERVSETLRRIVTYCADGLSGEGLREEYVRIYQHQDVPGYLTVDADSLRQAGDSLLALADLWKVHRV